MKIRHSEPYAPLRQKAYPLVGDQLDALLKLAIALRDNGFKLPEETEEWINKCSEVKNTYKKPNAQ